MSPPPEPAGPIAAKSEKPLPSTDDAEEDEETDAGQEDDTESPDGERTPVEKPTVAPAGPPQFKVSNFILIFLFFLGIWMLFDTAARMQVAQGLGYLLYPAFGFNGRFPLLTMALIGLLQMLFSAIAYNYTTDWVEQARVQAHAKAIRPLQMAAVRSGKRHHQEAIKPHMNDLNARQSRLMIGQLKGMAVTWFLLIAMYTWVYIFLTTTNPVTKTTVVLFGAQVDLLGNLWIIPAWFLVFSLYTLPFNLILRRVFKHVSLRSHPMLQSPAPGNP